MAGILYSLIVSSRRGAEDEHPAAADPSEDKAGDLPFQWWDVVPLLWLALAGAGYAILAYQGPESANPTGEIPGVTALDPVVVPLLLSLLLAAIIRYFCLRSVDSTR